MCWTMISSDNQKKRELDGEFSELQLWVIVGLANLTTFPLLFYMA